MSECADIEHILRKIHQMATVDDEGEHHICLKQLVVGKFTIPVTCCRVGKELNSLRYGTPASYYPRKSLVIVKSFL